jgi:hypothetical protein
MTASCSGSHLLYGIQFQTDFHSKRNLTAQLSVHIQLSFPLILATVDRPRVKLGTPTWKDQVVGYCGTCSWCNLVQDGARRTIESVKLDTIFRKGKGKANRRQNLQIEVKLVILSYHLPRWLILRGHITLSGDDVALLTTELVVAFQWFANKDDPAAKFLRINRRPVTHFALSWKNVRKIKRWLNACDRTHVRCKHPTTELLQAHDSLPTRLIRIDAENIRLVITSELSADTRFIALSYCWGGRRDYKSLLRTTRDTYQQKLDGIAFEKMPLTFQDAIIVARALQIQHLWIDSLCIIQNDEHDWQVESSRMADIFSSAYLTIVTATADSCHESFLHREERPFFTLRITPARNPAASGFVKLRHQPGKQWRCTDRMAEISSHRWLTRGWTFQEERLARRVLMFGENKFFFDCKTSERAEDTDVRRPRPAWIPSLHKEPREHPSEHSDTDLDRSGVVPIMDSCDHWQTLCSHYSQRRLTFDRDKLPAISGIASKIYRNTKSLYLAGLWNDNQAHDLFWFTLEQPTKPRKYRAPSWSWAALIGRVNWTSSRGCTRNDCNRYCRILDASTTLAGLDPFGAVSDGYLTLSAVLVKVRFSRLKGAGKFPWRVFIDDTATEFARGDLDAVKGLRRPDPEAEASHFAILTAECNEPATQPRGLLLQNLGRQPRGLNEYRRVGMMFIRTTAVENAPEVLQTTPRQTIIIT